MAIIITIEVTDEEILENYTDVHPDLIVSDFMDYPASWMSDGKCNITCVNTEFKEDDK